MTVHKFYRPEFYQYIEWCLRKIDIAECYAHVERSHL
jgi:hypothetical protein